MKCPVCNGKTLDFHVDFMQRSLLMDVKEIDQGKVTVDQSLNATVVEKVEVG